MALLLLLLLLLVVLLVAGGYLLSFPLGHWLDLHPLEHPLPWAARMVLFLWFALVLYLLLKLFSGRVSACAWMIMAWFLIFVLAMVLASRYPSVAHIGLLPLAMFAIGSIADLFRKKSPAPLLVASVLGFATTAFISFQHFFLFDGVANFGASHARMAAMVLMALAAMPMLLAYVKKLELDWKPVRWLLGHYAALLQRLQRADDGQAPGLDAGALAMLLSTNAEDARDRRFRLTMGRFLRLSNRRVSDLMRPLAGVRSVASGVIMADALAESGLPDSALKGIGIIQVGRCVCVR